MKKVKLICKIENITNGFDCKLYNYSVWDGKKKVANGTSSSLDWVRNDAGGYHTKDVFDKLYPNGWEVEFGF